MRPVALLNNPAKRSLKPTLSVPDRTERARAGLKPRSGVPFVKKGSLMDVPEMCGELQCLQRQRAWHMKSRIMIANRLQATVAGTLGYHSGMKEAERGQKMAEADKLIKQIAAGQNRSHQLSGLVLTTLRAINGFENMKKDLEKKMVKFAKQLPVAAWVEEPEQRGFGLLMLAIVVGEAGDLSNYANPGKLWRRFGLAPYSKDGENLMGATWRSRGNGRRGTKLHAEDWEAFGYSPRRRSIAYLIGEGLMKQNGRNGAGDFPNETDAEFVGPYRQRYDVKKQEAAEKHPDWIKCQKCDGSGESSGKKCSNCKGTGEVWMHCHRHGMLLATKLLLKELLLEWHRNSHS